MSPEFGSVIRPYVGGGIGWARTRFTIDQNSGPALYQPSESDGLAWQLGAGFNVRLSDHASVGLGYRYFHAGDQTFTVQNFGVLHPAPTFDGGGHQNVTMSLSFDLN